MALLTDVRTLALGGGSALMPVICASSGNGLGLTASLQPQQPHPLPLTGFSNLHCGVEKTWPGGAGVQRVTSAYSCPGVVSGGIGELCQRQREPSMGHWDLVLWDSKLNYCLCH